MTSETTDLGGQGERPTYDYIVIGAGPAGCAVARRLAQSSTGTTVALVEAGPAKASMLSDIPLGIAALVPMRSRRNYAYETTPQAGFGGRKGYQPRGRGLGGSSLINAMVYTRGQPQDYDEWAALGCKGWGWADVLPYFKRSEDNARGADAWHGVGGPLHVSDLSYRNPAVEAFVEAAVQAGFPRNADFNGAAQEGVGAYQVFQKNGRRYNAARAYLQSAIRRRTSRSFPKPRRAASCSRADRRSASSFVAPEKMNGLTRGVRSSSAAAPSDRRNSSWSRGSGRLSISRASESTSSRMRPRSERIFTIIATTSPICAPKGRDCSV